MKSVIKKYVDENGNAHDYLFYAPLTEEKNLPVIIFLHGAGECGNDIQTVRIGGLPKHLDLGLEINAYVICPQCPENTVWSDFIFQLKKFIDFAVDECGGDKKRLSLTGLSMGGFGTWAMALAFPNCFSAIVPICGGGMSWRASRIKDLPIWAFHGDADTDVPISLSYNMVDAVNNCGGNAKLTVFHSVGHNSWDTAYTQTASIDFLISAVNDRID